MSKFTKHLRIVGLVQGVGFRASMYYAAKNNGVTGWVRNRRDGSVEAVVQGTEEQVRAMMIWAKEGPGGAEVQDVEVSEGTGDFSEFAIKETL